MSVLVYNVTPRPPVYQAIQWDGTDNAAAAITQLARYSAFLGNNPPAGLRPMLVEADWSVTAGVLTVDVTMTLNGQPPNVNSIVFDPNDWYVSGQGKVDDFTFKLSYEASIAGQFSYEGH